MHGSPFYTSPPLDAITYVPIATPRVRTRGYDQSRLIANALARRLALPVFPLLARQGTQRQVGASGTVRRQQLRGAFRSRNLYLIQNSRLLLVDDVLTTGSTLEAAALALNEAGAPRVSAVVFAAA